MVGFDDYSKSWYDFSYFLSEYTKDLHDLSDRTRRLRKIDKLLYEKKIADEFLFHMKEVKYFEAFDLFGKVGDDIAKTYNGVFFKPEEIFEYKQSTFENLYANDEF